MTAANDFKKAVPFTPTGVPKGFGHPTTLRVAGRVPFREGGEEG